LHAQGEGARQTAEEIRSAGRPHGEVIKPCGEGCEGHWGAGGGREQAMNRLGEKQRKGDHHQRSPRRRSLRGRLHRGRNHLVSASLPPLPSPLGPSHGCQPSRWSPVAPRGQRAPHRQTEASYHVQQCFSPRCSTENQRRTRGHAARQRVWRNTHRCSARR